MTIETAIAIRAEDHQRMEAMRYPAPADMTDADIARATDDLTFVQSVRKSLEQAKLETLTPVRRRLDELRGQFDALLGRVGETEQRIKHTILEWRQHRAREAERAARAAAEATASLAAAEAKSDALAAGLSETAAREVRDAVARRVHAQVADEIAPVPVPRATAGLAGTASVRVVWDFEIEDDAKLPREYLMPNAVKIGQVVRATEGAAAIPGVKIIRRETIVGRRR